MLKSESIQLFDSQGEGYKRAFEIFLDLTGAENGEVTKAFAGAFRHTIAVEPNPHLLALLEQAIPPAGAIGAPILAADPKAHGDFVLCSYILYYISAEEWIAHLDRLVSWSHRSV